MRTIAHWTVRYIYDRARYMLHECSQGDHLWLTPGAIRLLKSLLYAADRRVEFGSGRSTIVSEPMAVAPTSASTTSSG
jgi:hypothetical protein